MKYFLLILAFCFISNYQSTIAQVDLQKLKQYVIAVDALGSEKSPAAAFGLSMILPGLGQFYSENGGTGAVFLVMSIAGIVVSQVAEEQKVRDIGYYGSGVVWLISLISAPFMAASHNDDLKASKAYYQKKYLSLLNYDTKYGNLSFDAGPIQNGFGCSVRLDF